MSTAARQESELTPTGSNLLDGRFAVFGYVVDNAPLLADLQVPPLTSERTMDICIVHVVAML